MKLVNLTAHRINVVVDGCTVGSWPPSGTIARLAERIHPDIPVRERNTKVPTERTLYLHEVAGLPDPVAGTVFLVSRVLAAHVPREDLYFPSGEVRDEAGQIVGCRALGRFAHEEGHA